MSHPGGHPGLRKWCYLLNLPVSVFFTWSVDNEQAYIVHISKMANPNLLKFYFWAPPMILSDPNESPSYIFFFFFSNCSKDGVQTKALQRWLLSHFSSTVVAVQNLTYTTSKLKENFNLLLDSPQKYYGKGYKEVDEKCLSKGY